MANKVIAEERRFALVRAGVDISKGASVLAESIPRRR
jgi:hypothetical protein